MSSSSSALGLFGVSKEYRIDEECREDSSFSDFSVSREGARDSSASESEEDDLPPLPVKHYDRPERARHPSCGMSMQRQRRDRPAPPQRYSILSSSTNDDDDTNEGLKYSKINKPFHRDPFLPPRAPPSRTMLQDVSPVLRENDVRPVGLRQRSRDTRMWRPQATSSVIDVPLPRYFPNTDGCRGESRQLHNYGEILRHEKNLHHQRFSRPLSPTQSSESSYFGSSRSPTRFTPIYTAPLFRPHARVHSMSCESITPEYFGCPSLVARKFDSKGVLELRMTMSPGLLEIHFEHAYYFTCESSRPMTTFIQVEVHHRERDLHHRKRVASRRVTKGFKTRTIRNNRRPHFGETIPIQTSPGTEKDRITISAWERRETSKQMIGCMTFQMPRLIKKYGISYENGEYGSSVVVVADKYFLMARSEGERHNLPMRKITRSTSYSVDGPSACTSASSSSLHLRHSPSKMLRSSEYGSSLLPTRSPPRRSHPLPLPGDSRSAQFDLSDSSLYEERRKPIESLDFTTASSSTGSLEEYDIRRMTLPEITTSDAASSECPASPRRGLDHSFLSAHPHGPSTAAESSDSNKKKGDGGVRRAASFTFSPTGSLSKHNRRPPAVVAHDDHEQATKKKILGPLSKTFSFLRSKVDSAMSTSSLCPTKQEVKQWEQSFDSLLHHKYGQMLFAQFVQKEFSSENIEFWLAVQEFKKMKDGKKATIQRAQEIYKEFVEPRAPRELNLDSDTRAATKAAVDGGCRTDCFSLAQSKIEQLMAKDSYRRFLKDKLFLDMLSNCGGVYETENAPAK